MRTKIVPVSNVARLSAASEALLDRAAGMPGMGLIHGDTGLGKTTAVTWLITRNNGVYVRALSTTTPSSLLRTIARELDLDPRPSNVETVEAIVQRLAETGRPLFVDEADYLVNRAALVETLRDIHDLATVPVVLIGMAGIQRKIKARQQLTGRIAQWVEFQPATREDVRLLAQHLAEVEIDDALLGALHEATHGSMRLAVVGLSHIEARAKAKGQKRIGLADWPAGTNFFFGDAPRRPAKAA
ncbi:AAA family ATPase [Mizugakiibacter sediminis]|nr:ATP-binding protein [Mizugakiibacter sediminis]